MKSAKSLEEQAYYRLRDVDQGIKNTATAHRAKMDADVDARNLAALYHDIRRRQLEIQALLTTPNIRAFARRVQNDNAYSLQADFAATNVIANNVKTLLRGLLPINADGTLKEKRFNAQNTYDFEQVLAIDMGALRVEVDLLLANIES